MKENTNTELKEGDIVLCIVKSIEGTTVFLQLEKDRQGTMIFSEVSPGRIRNIREFVSPNKKIVCKIIRIRDNHAELSLRRVTAKEREEVMDKYKKEIILANMLKPVLKEETEKVFLKIKESYEAGDFLNEIKENPSLIEKFVSKKEAEELKKIFAEKKEREKEVKKEIKLSSASESGLYAIKEVLETDKADICYLGSSRFSITVKADNYKSANYKLDSVLNEIKTKAKSLKLNLEIKEK